MASYMLAHAAASHVSRVHLRYRRHTYRFGRLHAEAWQRTLAHFGFDVPFEAVRSQIGKGGDQLLPVFVPADELERLAGQIEKYRSELFKREYLPRVKPFPSRARPLPANTGGRSPHRPRLVCQREEVRSIQEDRGIADLVDGERRAATWIARSRVPMCSRSRSSRLKVEPERRDRRRRHAVRRHRGVARTPENRCRALRRVSRAGSPRGRLRGDLSGSRGPARPLRRPARAG